MVLLAQPEPFLFERHHHAVEHVDYLVSFMLIDVRETAAEILFAQQVDAVCDAADRFHHTAVEHNQQYDGEHTG